MNTLEVCAASLNSALTAGYAKADRIELCSALTVGGLTPGIGLIATVTGLVDIPVHVLIRPRAGGFCYSTDEKHCILREIKAVVKTGAAGIVFGALNSDGSPDSDFLNEVYSTAAGIECCFHRAFDLIPDKFSAIDQLAELKFNRILSSGGAITAWEGREVLRLCQEYASGRIEIMAGSGINSENVGRLMEYTGIRSVHSSARGKNFTRQQEMFPDEPDTDSDEVKAILKIINNYS